MSFLEWARNLFGAQQLQPAPSKPTLDLGKLLSLGFFKYVPPDDLDQVLRDTTARDDAFAGDTLRRYHADAENLAECGVRDFLCKATPFLRREGVDINVTYPDARGVPAYAMQLTLRTGGPMVEVTEDAENGDPYVLFLGEREFVVFRDVSEGDSWGCATLSTIALLNELLVGHGSRERAYAVNGGNDLQLVFATQEMAEIINAASEPRECLYDSEASREALRHSPQRRD